MTYYTWMLYSFSRSFKPVPTYFTAVQRLRFSLDRKYKFCSQTRIHYCMIFFILYCLTLCHVFYTIFLCFTFCVYIEDYLFITHFNKIDLFVIKIHFFFFYTQ
jgi:hypothetical protein